LTLVLGKDPRVPDVVTAGLATVGIRVPSHPLALALLTAAGVPIAAPSANRFTELSPTTAEHVRRGLGGEVDLILDGGSTQVGIESTVVSLAAGRAVLLRPGMVTRAQIEELAGPVEMAAGASGAGAHPAPGMHERHYSPKTRLHIISGGALPAGGRGAYLWRTRPAPASRSVRMPEEAGEYAAALYRMLHELDQEGWNWLAVEALPEGTEWEAVRDRLSRAAGGTR
jgi:L-threonylcarbamoyladenylate synthase